MGGIASRIIAVTVCSVDVLTMVGGVNGHHIIYIHM